MPAIPHFLRRALFGDHHENVASRRKVMAAKNQPKPLSVSEMEAILGEELPNLADVKAQAAKDGHTLEIVEDDDA